MAKSIHEKTKIDKLFSPWMLLIIIAGIVVNIGVSKLVILFNLPLYIDCIGTIITAALGGVIPGMIVGFLSNSIGSITEPITLYFAILSVMIGYLAAQFSKKGMFKKWKGWIVSALVFAFIGGSVGSVITWLLYGSKISGIAEPYAILLHQHISSEFASQFICDTLIDIVDKLITVGISCLILRFFPQKWTVVFPYGFLYNRSSKEQVVEKKQVKSVNLKIINILTVSLMFLGIVSVAISTVYHHDRLMQIYKEEAQNYSQEAESYIDGDKVKDFIKNGEKADEYRSTEIKLEELYMNSPHIDYVYVYDVTPEGCQVVFDVDTPDVKGEEPGTIIENEQYYYDNEDAFRAGSDVPSTVTFGKYGSLITAYTPIKDSNGTTVAYVGVDSNLGDYIRDILTFIIQIVAVIFAIVLLSISFALWFINRKVIMPVDIIVDQVTELDKISPESWLDSDVWKNKADLKTGDEFEILYNTVCANQENVCKSVRDKMETEVKLVQTKELEKVNAELALAITKADNANRAKTEFLSRMSHDIRTPLNAIIGTASLAEEEVENPAAMMESIETIQSSGQFLLGLINDILDINKIEDGKIELRPEVYYSEDFIRDIDEIICPLAEKKNIEFVFDMKCDNEIIYVDKLRYKQIFFNLLSNAIKYTHDGGKVEFTITQHDTTDDIVGIRSVVRDNGIGMSEEYMKHIYEPFSRDKNVEINSTEGSGLGLAIVKSIVDSMGGTISVKSEIGVGTEFTVDVFLKIPKENDVNSGLRQDVDYNVLNGKKILLVEDNKINTKIAVKMLEKIGCIITTAENGAVSLSKFKESEPYSFDAILMDIRMPVMDGLTATKEIRALDRADAKTIPIIALTANAYAEDVKMTIEAGMTSHLSKPIEPKLLYGKLAECIAQV